MIIAEHSGKTLTHQWLLSRYSPLQFHQAIQNSLGSRRTSRDVHVDGNDTINSLNRRIVIVKATARGTSTKRHHPLGLRHLLVHTLQDRGKFVFYRPYNHQWVSLSRAEARQ